MKVCLPGLHISQGIFLKLFTLLEDECHKLDLKMASNVSSSTGMSATAYAVYSDALKELSEVKEELDLAKDNATLLDEMQYVCISSSSVALSLAKSNFFSVSPILEARMPPPK